METHFHKELQKLRLKVLEMAAYATRAIEDAAQALRLRDAALARSVIEGDRKIDALECDVDEHTLRLIALDQPMAVDLRSIVATMRLSMDLERIGDEAVNIAESALFLAERPAIEGLDTLHQLTDYAVAMARKAIGCFCENDLASAREVHALDRRCNELEVLAQRELMDVMRRDGATVERAMSGVFAARSLERVGDLSTNIAETVIFIVEGSNIKHACQLAAEPSPTSSSGA